MQQIEPSQQPRRDAKLPVITGAAAKNAGDADADLDEEGAPSSSALPPPSGRAKTAAASRAGTLTIPAQQRVRTGAELGKAGAAANSFSQCCMVALGRCMQSDEHDIALKFVLQGQQQEQQGVVEGRPRLVKHSPRVKRLQQGSHRWRPSLRPNHSHVFKTYRQRVVSSPDRHMLRRLCAGERGRCFKACSAAP